MPRVPQQNYLDEVSAPQSPLTGDKFVAPENLLVAATNMNDMGRLFQSGGAGKFAGARGHKVKPGTSLKAKR